MKGFLGALFAHLCFLTAAQAEPVGIDDFVSAAQDADIVILGEIHDNPAHHRNQAEIVRRLSPGTLVFEMIPQALEAEVNDMIERGAAADEIAEALDWGNSGWPDFSFYNNIIKSAPDAHIFGGGQPIADVRRAMVEGAAGPFGPDAAIYGLDQPLDPAEKAARVALQGASHCHAVPEELLEGMVEAQRFRDAGLADSALWARTTTGSQVVVITGTGHADRQRGIPAAIATATPDVSVITLGQFESPPENPEGYDYYMIENPPEREDPCLAFAPEERGP